MLPKIGLALGAGGAKGLAHIGILKVLKKNDIPIDFITGTSIGSVIGALYAAGCDINMMEKLAIEINNRYLVDLSLPKWGLVKGNKAHSLIRVLTHNKTFEELNIPLSVVATDLEKGERVIFNEGNVADAVRASISVPGVVMPYIWNDKILVDGAVVDSVPAELVSKMGAEVVIAVDLQFHNDKQKVNINNIYDVITQSIELLERPSRNKYAPFADVIVKPDLTKYMWTNFEDAKKIIEIGEESCLSVLDDIKEKIKMSK